MTRSISISFFNPTLAGCPPFIHSPQSVWCLWTSDMNWRTCRLIGRISIKIATLLFFHSKIWGNGSPVWDAVCSDMPTIKSSEPDHLRKIQIFQVAYEPWLSLNQVFQLLQAQSEQMWYWWHRTSAGDVSLWSLELSLEFSWSSSQCFQTELEEDEQI